MDPYAFDPDKTNGVGFQLAGMDPNAYKNFTSYGNAIGSGMNEEAAKRQAFDDNGYANYNYDGTQRNPPPSAATPAATQAPQPDPVQPTAQPAPAQSGGAGAWSPPPTPAQPTQQVAPVQAVTPVSRGLAGTNTGYQARPQAGIQNTFRGMPSQAGRTRPMRGIYG